MHTGSFRGSPACQLCSATKGTGSNCLWDRPPCTYIPPPLLPPPRLERDESEFARLAQLGDVLGLTQLEVASVHSDLAEQAFKSQVQQVMGEGALTPDRLAGLEAVRTRMGLPKATADKVLKGFQNQKLIAGMQVSPLLD